MAIQSDASLKTYFETGDVPTQQEFEHFIDSKYSKFHGLGTEAAVTNEIEIIIPEKRILSRLIVWAIENAVINLGDTLGTKEHLEDEPLTANVPRIFDIDPIFALTQKSVFLEFDDGQGTPSGNVIYYIQ